MVAVPMRDAPARSTALPGRTDPGVQSAGSGGARILRRAWPYLCIVALALMPLLPVLLMDHVPTSDGPAHLNEAFVLANHGDSGFARITEQYVISAAPSPNLFAELGLAVLLLVLSPAAVEKVVAVVVVALVSGAMTYAVRSVSAERWWLAALAAPLATGYLFFFGFYNFCIGTGLSLLATGLYLRHRSHWSLWAALSLAILLLLTVSAHLLPFVMAAGCIGLVCVFDAAAQLRARASAPARVRHVATLLQSRDVVVPVAAMVIPTAVTLLFLVQSSEVRTGGQGADVLTRLAATFNPGTLARYSIGQVTVFTRAEIAFSASWVAIVGLTVGYAVLAGRRALIGTPASALAAMAVLSIAALAVVPDGLGTLAYIHRRFVLFAVLFALLAAAAVEALGRLKTLSLVSAALVTTGLAAVRVPAEARHDEDLREFGTVAAQMRPQSTFVTWRAWPGDSPVAAGLSPTAHAGDRVAVQTRSVNLTHLDGRYAYFPAHFRSLEDLGARTTDLLSPQDWRAFLLQARQRGEEPDYVLLWGRARAAATLAADPDYEAALAALNERYERRFVSGPAGTMELFERCSRQDTRCGSAPDRARPAPQVSRGGR